MTWTDEEFEEQKEPFNEVMVLVGLATIEDHHVDVVADVVSSPRAIAKINDDEEISD